MSDSRNQSLGNFLKRAREHRSLSIDDVAAYTKLRTTVIEALEADHYQKLPPKAFLRGHIVSYCECVGIDPAPVLDRYHDVLDKPPIKKLNINESLGGYTFESTRRRISLKSLIAILIMLFLVSGGGIILYLSPDFFSILWSPFFKTNEPVTTNTSRKSPEISATSLRDRGEQPDESQEFDTDSEPDSGDLANQPDSASTTLTASIVNTAGESPATSAGTDDARREGKKQEPKSSIEPDRTPSAKDSLEKGDSLPADRIYYKVVLKAKADVWIRYQVDKRPLSRYKLLSGKLLVLRAEKGIFFQISDPAKLELRYDTTRDYRPLKNEDILTIHGIASIAHPALGHDELEKRFSDSDAFPSD